MCQVLEITENKVIARKGYISMPILPGQESLDKKKMSRVKWSYKSLDYIILKGQRDINMGSMTGH